MWSITFDKDGYHNISEMREWCRANIGETVMYLNPDNLDANVRVLFNFGETTFYFKHKEEYNWFILRWG